MTDSTRLIRLAEIREVLAELMKGREQLALEPYRRRDENGWLPLAELPPEDGLRLSDLTGALDGLPDPAPESALVEAIGPVLRQRACRYLVQELGELCAQRWPGPAEAVAAATPGSALRCMACGGGFPPGSKASRRTCSDSCRKAMERSRRRSRQGPATVTP